MSIDESNNVHTRLQVHNCVVQPLLTGKNKPIYGLVYILLFIICMRAFTFYLNRTIFQQISNYTENLKKKIVVYRFNEHNIGYLTACPYCLLEMCCTS